jgi:uncharacterized protein YbjT (DUF2867 family)
VNLLIAGAGGVLGRELVRQALFRGDHVAALVLRSGEMRVIEHPRLRIIEADVTKPEQLAGVCNGFEQVISCIGITRLKGKITHDDVDYRGNLNLLEDAKRSGVARFGFISPAGTDVGWNQAPLLNAKYRFEQALRASGLEWVIFRSGGFFPDLVEMKKLAAKSPLYAIGQGDSLSTPIHVPELAALMLAGTGQQKNAVVEVGGPEDLTWRETCALCFETQGLPVRIQSAPVWLCRLILALLKPFSYRHWAMGRLLLFMSTHDVRTPKRGTVKLRDYLAEPSHS